MSYKGIITWKRLSPEYSIDAVYDSMVWEKPILFNGENLLVNAMARESGGKPCVNWLITLSNGVTYYWNVRKGGFSAETAIH